MSNGPEIAGELRGLLEEIVADPRSAIRLTPRRAIGDWFAGGETIRAREVDGTKAERHLIAAHREALARMLLEGAKIAYWKAPMMSHRPLGPDGIPYDERRAEEAWIPVASRRARFRAGSVAGGVELLRQCLSGIAPEQGHAMAQASLSLVPCDAARYYVARTLPWDRPRAAMALFERLATRGDERWRVEALSSWAARMCSVGILFEAAQAYRMASELNPADPTDTFYLFNLLCALGRDAEATEAAIAIGRLTKADDRRVEEAKTLLMSWWRGRTQEQVSVARNVSARISGRIPEVAMVLCRAFES